MLRQEPSHAVAPAAPARLTDDRERRGAKVSQSGVVSGQNSMIARAQEQIKNTFGTKKPRAGLRGAGQTRSWMGVCERDWRTTTRCQ
jgi:hypothetical protein